MKIAILTTDSREHFREYQKTQPYFGTAPQALLQGLARHKDVEVHVLSCMQQAMTSAEKLADNIWYHGLYVPKLGWLRTGYQGCIREFRRKLRQIQPAVVHGQGTERDCALGAVLSGFPSVITIHGNLRLLAKLNRAKPFSYQWLAARLEGFTIPRADGVVCITRYTQEAVRTLARKTWVVPNAVDESFFEIQRRSTQAAEAPLVVCVGEVMLRKNQQRLIQALDPLAAVRPLQLLFLGHARPSDPYAVQFLEMVNSRPWCRHGGFADREKLKEVMSRAALLVLPSLEDNCPMVVLEAMAAGVPVLTTEVGGVPDLIEGEVNGLLCDPYDLASLRLGAQRLLDNPALGLTLAAQAKERALQRYYPENVARQHRSIYREVCSSAS